MLREMRIAGIAMACLVTTVAMAEDRENQLNLWISHHFAGMENYYIGDYTDAAKLFESAAQDAQRKVRDAETVGALGRAYTALGRFKEAESQYREALDMKRKALGKKHPMLAVTMNDLADLLYLTQLEDKERPSEAEALYREALEQLERDQFSLEVSRSLNGLALISNDREDKVAAEELLKRAANVHEKGNRRDHAYAATVLTNLGILYTQLGRYDEASPMFERAKYIQDVKLRPGHPDVSVRMHATAALLSATGHAGEAARLATDAEALRDAQAAKGDLY